MAEKLTNTESSETNISGINITCKNFIDKYIVPIILSIIATVLYNTFTLNQINDRLIAIENNTTNNININIQDLQPTKMGKIDINYDENYLQASTDNDKIHISIPSNDETEIEELSLSTTDVAIYSIEAPSWQLNDKIAIDTKSGISYTAEDLINKKILLPYKSEGQECYFYGQFNENNQWDGDCIINIYENDNLISIMESEYEDGVLLAYKQVFQSTRTNYDVWSFSDRINKTDYNTGKTWSYYKSRDYAKDFEFENVSIKDILDVKSFEYIVKNNGLEEYYYGRTSDGFFNDTTGNAYLVKYNENGYVKYLYVGKIVDGYPNDETNNAWCISLGYDNKNYYYLDGKFKNGQHITKDFKIMTLDEINYMIDYDDFECELKWIDNI